MKKSISILLLFALLTSAFRVLKDPAIEARAEGPFAPKPNIILIMADDMGYSDLSCMGSEIPTPNLDRLAGNGILMTQFYNAGRCCPTRASLLTGLYQHQAGVGDMDSDYGIPAYQGQLKSNTVTLAEMLKTAGYVTGISGKWHVGNAPEVQPLRRGFDEQLLINGGGGLYFYPARIDRTLMLENKPYVPDTTTFYSTDAINDYAIDFVEKHRAEPYFLYVPHVAPHFPLQAKQADIAQFRGRYRAGYAEIQRQRLARMKRLGLVSPEVVLPKNNLQEAWAKLSEAEKDTVDWEMATYAAQIKCLDDGIGRIIEKLEATGQLERTLILFLSDNGGEASVVTPRKEGKPSNAIPGDRHNWTSYGQKWATVSNTPYRKYKMYVHEGGIRTPLIVHWPKQLPKSRLENQPGCVQPGHITDIFPTLLEIARANYPAKSTSGEPTIPLAGTSLLPIWQGKKRTGDFEKGWEHEGNRAYRKGDWKLVSAYADKKWELYNLKKDPVEMHDLSSAEPTKTEEMKQLYQQWAERVGAIEQDKVLEAKRR